MGRSNALAMQALVRLRQLVQLIRALRSERQARKIRRRLQSMDTAHPGAGFGAGYKNKEGV